MCTPLGNSSQEHSWHKIHNLKNIHRLNKVNKRRLGHMLVGEWAHSSGHMLVGGWVGLLDELASLWVRHLESLKANLKAYHLENLKAYHLENSKACH
jgi:hypothetical protein